MADRAGGRRHARAIPVGTRLTTDDLKVVAWPAKTQVPGAFSNVPAVVDRGVIAPIGLNEPVTADRVAGPGGGAGLPPIIPAGMRAMSVRVNEVVGVAGFVLPGTRVDVLVAVDDDGDDSNKKEPMARTVVSNVQVLTAGTRYDQEEAKDGKPQRSTVVTLAVLPDDGERIALAASEGQDVAGAAQPARRRPGRDDGHQAGGADEGHRPGAGARRAEAKDGAGRRSVVAGTGAAGAADLQGRSDSRGQADGRGGQLTCDAHVHRNIVSRSSRDRGPRGRVVRGRRAPRHAAPGGARGQPACPLTTGRSTVLTTDFDVTRIAVTNPAVADAVVVQPREILIDGKAPGTISLIVWGGNQRMQYDLVVEQPTPALEQQLQQLFPAETIQVAVNADAIILSGRVSSTEVMLRAAEVARAVGAEGQRHQHDDGARRAPARSR